MNPQIQPAARWSSRFSLFFVVILCSLNVTARGANRPDELFDKTRVLSLAIEIGAAELKAMKEGGGHAYVRCVVREGDRTFRDVGIHYKGDPEKEIASGKPDFTVNFSKFVSSQHFHRHKRITLQASREDPSYVAAPVALEMFRQAGVPAPRCTFARLSLNGRDLGLYQVIEGVNRDFLRGHFSKSNGNLYDEGERTDVTGKLDKDSGKDRDDQSDVDALAAAALLKDPRQRWQQLQRRLDVDRFLSFTALEVLLWQKDSYALKARKFRIYHDPASDRMVFFPKGVEQVLEKTDGPLIPEWKGVVTKALLTTAEGERRYRKTVARLLDTVFAPARVRTRAHELAAIIDPAVTSKDLDTAVAQFCERVANRSAFLREQLSR